MHRDTVFIVDDDAPVRDSIALLLSLSGYATASFASAEDFLRAFESSWQGCLIVDLRMPGMSGLDLQRALVERAPALPVIVITAHGDVAAARTAFLSQAIDFIEKPFEPTLLIGAVERALACLNANLPAQVTDGQSSAHSDLSPRERVVLALLVAGEHNRRIAERLGISHRTVEVHKARVLQKLGARNVVDLVRMQGHGQK